MSIGDAEIKTQERVIRFFKDPEILGYQYIGCLLYTSLPKWRAPDMQNQTTGVRAYRRITPFRLHLTSGDDGIDGVIMEDKLGFSLIYMQAKEWAPDRVVGQPDIQSL